MSEIEWKNTLAFLNNYTDKMVAETKAEIDRKRTRQYKNRTVTAPINSSGSGRESIAKQTVKNGFNIIGNDYLEDVDEGTTSTKATLTDIIRWMNIKPVTLKEGDKTVPSSRKKVIARMIQKKLLFEGIKRTAFLTDLIGNSIDKLQGIENSVADDVTDNIEIVLSQNGFVKKNGKYELDIKR